MGTLNAGRVRVSVSMPDTEELGKCQLAARVGPWTKKAGGLGTEMSWSTTLEVVDEIEPKPSGKGAAGGKGGKRGSGGGGDLVALVWENSEDAHAVGSIQTLSGSDLADMRPGDYAELKGVTDEIPTVVLNNLYSPLKAYVHGRAAALTDEATERAKERYAVGVGVALLMLDQHVKKQSKEGKEADEEGTEEAQRAAARGILSVLPDYDQLAKEMED